MKIGYDPPKSERNLRERGFDFGFAARVFESELTFEWEDSSAHGERRYNVIGPIDDQVYVVTYTERGNDGEVTWIISARLAEKREKDIWRSSIL